MLRGDLLIRILVSIATAFALIPLWGLADSTAGRLAIVAATAVVLLVASLVVRPLKPNA
jgi:hypothetical protein